MLFRYELLGFAYFPNRLSVLAEMQVLRAWSKYAESSPLFLAKGLEGMMNEEISLNPLNQVYVFNSMNSRDALEFTVNMS